MTKVVVLNSGGFDSVCLMNLLHYEHRDDYELHSLHFTYGARNEEQQLYCVNKVCEKVGAENKIIALPEFSWTKSKFFEDGYDYETQYLEYRNLIFLSYALSYAQAIGAEKIFMAVLNGGGYPDTSVEFFAGINSFSIKLSNIEIVTPFANAELKTDLISIGVLTGMETTDYWSCDTPNEHGGPCGKCLDCIAIEEIDSILDVDTPFKALYQSNFDYSDPRFLRLLGQDTKNREVRALINNDCQLNCKHCFYGFEEMTGEKIDPEIYYQVLKDLVMNYNFNSIHFAGKEPLYGDDIDYYARQIYEDGLSCCFSVVTNGIAVPQKITMLKRYGIDRLFLSVDDILVEKDSGVRPICNVTERALEACNEAEVPVEVFIDLHKDNIFRLYDIIGYLLDKYYIDTFTVRTIRSLGKAKQQQKISSEQLNEAFRKLKQAAERHSDVDFDFCISSEYTEEALKCGTLADVLKLAESCYTPRYYANLFVSLERYCNRYSDITLTPDGYVLGCASDVSRPDYAEIAAGNVLKDTLGSILEIGRKSRVNCAGKFTKCGYKCMVNKLQPLDFV